MSALAIRRQLRRHRRDLALIGTVLALAGAVAAHHSAMLIDTHQHAGMGAVAEMCLGVLAAAGVALLAAALAVVALGRWRPMLIGRAVGAMRAPNVPVTRARHGPAAVAVLCVSRC